MHVAYTDATVPQASAYATGKGVKVAFFGEGIDVNNPDLIRADGSHVIADYQDFTGQGPNAPTSGGEAFGDASSLAAQGRHDRLAHVVLLAEVCHFDDRRSAASTVGLRRRRAVEPKLPLRRISHRRSCALHAYRLLTVPTRKP